MLVDKGSCWNAAEAELDAYDEPRKWLSFFLTMRLDPAPLKLMPIRNSVKGESFDMRILLHWS
jgi:hypothetical protein